ncbi:MAG: hypothetical protein ABL872_17230 [Lacibacter sp.]
MQKKTGLALIVLLLLAQFSFSQSSDITTKIAHFGGTITATQNGISLIPSFSLGRPAVMFDLNVGNKKLSFEPFFRFGTNGKPWSFIFWWRYKVVNSEKFKMSIGAHPSFVFRTVPFTANGATVNTIQANRYAAGDLTPTYFISKTISVGVYYLYSHGLDKTSVQNTHFLTLNSSFSNSKLPGKLFVKFTPQVYYLNQDTKDGFYFTYSLTLGRKNFPLSAQTIMNKAIRTSIPGKDFVWNASIIYSFNKNYVRQQ